MDGVQLEKVAATEQTMTDAVLPCGRLRLMTALAQLRLAVM